MSQNSVTSISSCKSLFSSGKSSRSNPSSHSKGELSSAYYSLHIDCEAAKVKSQIEKDLHEKRVKELKELLTKIEDENWKYQPIDELLGLASS
ncbi:uncharacterized protein LOC143470304 isoform X2 [Clavelina lepadiformis]|uniref:uncharacterized protein LOC143470304 isoform X2 n=1 Tax=Clavelina lepadiformis TaxID=159417 RepID=UPI0040425F20